MMVAFLYEHLFESWLLYFKSSCLLMALEKQQKIAQMLESLPPILETWMEVQALGLSLTQP